MKNISKSDKQLNIFILENESRKKIKQNFFLRR